MIDVHPATKWRSVLPATMRQAISATKWRYAVAMGVSPWNPNPTRDDSPEGTTGTDTQPTHIAPSGLFDCVGSRIHGFAPVATACRPFGTDVLTPGRYVGAEEVEDDGVPFAEKMEGLWHTQGSGKSISMCCYGGKLLQQRSMKNPTLVVVTDRNEMDGQLYGQFCMAKDLLKQTPQQANSREELREMLASRESGGIIFTTVQKFSLLDDEDEHPRLCDRSNVVISDEAHRSQFALADTWSSADGSRPQ